MTTVKDPGATTRQREGFQGDVHAVRIRVALERVRQRQPVEPEPVVVPDEDDEVWR